MNLYQDPITKEVFAYDPDGSQDHLIREGLLPITQEELAAQMDAVRTLPQAKTAKLAALAAHRYAVETAGLTANGATIMTDRGSQAMITGAYVACQLDPARLIDFKGATGWMQIDAVTVFLIAAAVSSHVQTCFSIERSHAAAVEALTTIAAVDAYDITTGWAV
jgi:hypothetical protein